VDKMGSQTGRVAFVARGDDIGRSLEDGQGAATLGWFQRRRSEAGTVNPGRSDGIGARLKLVVTKANGEEVSEKNACRAIESAFAACGRVREPEAARIPADSVDLGPAGRKRAAFPYKAFQVGPQK